MNKQTKLKEELLLIEINKEGDLSKIESKLKEYNISQYKIDCDTAYDSCGYNVYYYAVSYVFENELHMITGTWDSN